MFNNIQAIEYYQQYLELKQEIMALTLQKESYIRFNVEEDFSQESLLETKVTEMKELLELLDLYGVSRESLLLLSMGIDIESKSKSSK